MHCMQMIKFDENYSEIEKVLTLTSFYKVV
jgi:hypothetical protein